MSGKVIAMFVAAAVSSASAATVGVVYKTIVGPGPVDAASREEGGVKPGLVKSAVVLNATDSYLGSFLDSSSDSDAPNCLGADNSAGCVVVAHDSRIGVKILGYTVPVPTPWLGGDSRDSYVPTPVNPVSVFWDPWLLDPEVVVKISRPRALLEGAALDAQSDGDGHGRRATDERDRPREMDSGGSQGDAANSDSGQTTIIQIVSPTPRLPITQTFDAGASPYGLFGYAGPYLGDAPSGGDPGAAGSPPADPGLPEYIPSPSPGAVPEMSTWLLALTGFAGLGLIKRRRGAAALTLRAH